MKLSIRKSKQSCSFLEGSLMLKRLQALEVLCTTSLLKQIKQDYLKDCKINPFGKLQKSKTKKKLKIKEMIIKMT